MEEWLSVTILAGAQAAAQLSSICAKFKVFLGLAVRPLKTALENPDPIKVCSVILRCQ